MFSVKTPGEVFEILKSHFIDQDTPCDASETIALPDACGRVLAEDISANEYVPGFHRSTVDGYAVLASDTFGCSDSIPAILELTGEVQMGEGADQILTAGSCVYVPTGGAIPDGADAMVMIEYTEDYGDGTIGIMKPAAPGMNMIYKGDDVFPGKKVLISGRKLTSSDIGALAAMGITELAVIKKPLVGIISTGDELVPVSVTPADGQIRDVNSAMLDALCREAGADTKLYGIIPDDAGHLTEAVESAIRSCDIILISGGSSVGTKDITAQIIEQHGNLLLHGIAMKPGKPTIVGNADGKPVFGLPGHPVAAFFVSQLFVRYLIDAFCGNPAVSETAFCQQHISAGLTEAISTNHGREEYLGVRLKESASGQRLAVPIHSKSGLISSLAGADGYICIPRDCEGLPAGAEVTVYLF